MNTLSQEGRRIVEDLSQSSGFSANAVESMLYSVAAGGGTQAQFSHPEFGGMGQWSQGGMIMIGDMFNNGLKDRVSRLCNDLAEAVGRTRIFAAPMQSQSQSQGGFYAPLNSNTSLFTGSSSGNWWPSELGAPSSTGGQNDMRYAVFPSTQRLAVQRNGETVIYDTGSHSIGGASQQQGGDQSLTFSSQHGTVRLDDLKRISGGGGTPQANQNIPAYESQPNAAAYSSNRSGAGAGADDVVALIERLHELNRKGILSDEEYAQKKQDLLSRL